MLHIIVLLVLSILNVQASAYASTADVIYTYDTNEYFYIGGNTEHEVQKSGYESNTYVHIDRNTDSEGQKPAYDSRQNLSKPVVESMGSVSIDFKHILDGDATGGGHRAGTGKPGKSEFPAGRSDDSIIHDISDIATDPTLKSRPGRGGRTITDGTRNGVDIRVIQEKNGDIVTGFPTNTPRNPR